MNREIRTVRYGTLFYIRENGRVLHLRKHKRKNDPNSEMYTLPGGKVEEDEKGGNPHGRLERAVKETDQETGIIPSNAKIKGVILFDNRERVFNDWKAPDDYLVYIFSAESYTGHVKKESKEGFPEWVDEKNIPHLRQNVGDSKMYEWINDGRGFFGVIKTIGKNKLDEKGTFVEYF